MSHHVRVTQSALGFALPEAQRGGSTGSFAAPSGALDDLLRVMYAADNVGESPLGGDPSSRMGGFNAALASFARQVELKKKARRVAAASTIATSSSSESGGGVGGGIVYRPRHFTPPGHHRPYKTPGGGSYGMKRPRALSEGGKARGAAKGLGSGVNKVEEDEEKEGLREEEDEEDGNFSYCSLCDGGDELLCCENCPLSFHPACLGLASVPEGDFLCKECEVAFAPPPPHPAMPPVCLTLWQGPWLGSKATPGLLLRDELLGVMGALKKHVFAPAAARPSPSDASATSLYKKLVKHPMDYASLSRNAAAGKYTGSGRGGVDAPRFVADLRLAVYNALLFHPPGSTMARMAQGLFRHTETALRDRVKLSPEESDKLKGYMVNEMASFLREAEGGERGVEEGEEEEEEEGIEIWEALASSLEITRLGGPSASAPAWSRTFDPVAPAPITPQVLFSAFLLPCTLLLTYIAGVGAGAGEGEKKEPEKESGVVDENSAATATASLAVDPSMAAVQLLQSVFSDLCKEEKEGQVGGAEGEQDNASGGIPFLHLPLLELPGKLLAKRLIDIASEILMKKRGPMSDSSGISGHSDLHASAVLKSFLNRHGALWSTTGAGTESATLLHYAIYGAAAPAAALFVALGADLTSPGTLIARSRDSHIATVGLAGSAPVDVAYACLGGGQGGWRTAVTKELVGLLIVEGGGGVKGRGRGGREGRGKRTSHTK